MAASGSEQGPNPNVVPPPLTPQNVHVHFPNNPVPKFDGNSESFITWKTCMLKYIAGVERNLTTILKDGPYVPMNVSSVVLNPDGSPRSRIKHRDQWSEEDHRLADLDTKLQNMILELSIKSMSLSLLFPVKISLIHISGLPVW